MTTNDERCFAVPGEDWIIDMVNPATGRSGIDGQTLEEIRARGERYARAEIVLFSDWLAAKAARQDTPIEWLATTRENYWDKLEVLFPAAQAGGAFLVGEPYDHHAATGRPRFACYKQVGERFYCSSRPITHEEFKGLFGRCTYDYDE